MHLPCMQNLREGVVSPHDSVSTAPLYVLGARVGVKSGRRDIVIMQRLAARLPNRSKSGDMFRQRGVPDCGAREGSRAFCSPLWAFKVQGNCIKDGPVLCRAERLMRASVDCDDQSEAHSRFSPVLDSDVTSDDPITREQLVRNSLNDIKAQYS